MKNVVFGILLLLSSTVFAQEYILFNGGVSQEERATAPANGTRLVFFVRAGSFLSDVLVTVTDSAGAELVNTRTNGPWLILNLPDGRYRISASLDSGETQSLVLDVAGDQEFGFMFTTVE